MFKKNFRNMKNKIAAIVGTLGMTPSITPQGDYGKQVFDVPMPKTPEPVRKPKKIYRSHDEFEKDKFASWLVPSNWNTTRIRFALTAAFTAGRGGIRKPGKVRIKQMKNLTLKSMYTRRQRVELHVNAVRDKNREAGKNRFGFPVWSPHYKGVAGMDESV